MATKSKSERPGAKCGARKTTDGTPCKNGAGFGTDHLGWGRCRNHGGSTKAGKLYAIREKAENTRILGDERIIEPVDALLEQVRVSAGHVRWYREMIDRFDDELGGLDAGRILLQLSEQGWSKAAWVKLYGEERDRLTKYAKMALDAGVAERQVKLAEKQGELLATAIRGILKDLGLTPEQESSAPDIVARHLRAVS